MSAILYAMRPVLGVLDFKPVQYHAPLYRCLTYRRNIDLDVLFLRDTPATGSFDPGFQVKVSWDIDLVSGYKSSFLAVSGQEVLRSPMTRISRLNAWLRRHDAIVIHGYTHPWMLLAIAACRRGRIPYFLRGDSQPRGHATGLQRHLRDALARQVVARSAAGLAIGQLNAQFYRRYRAPRVIFAPYSVDQARFSLPSARNRCDLLSALGLHPDLPVVMYCGKLYPGKRPLDLAEAISLLETEVNTIFVGDGILADEVRALLKPGYGAVTGFINQSEITSYYHAADIIVVPSMVENWGLVLNEAMASGTFPIATSNVGATPDLVHGVGEIYPCGDIAGLAAAISRGLDRIREPGSRRRVQERVGRYSLERTARGYEEAALAFAGSCAARDGASDRNGARPR
jgi:glycosyltransferase involved in cell wall biosynthesis